MTFEKTGRTGLGDNAQPDEPATPAPESEAPESETEDE